MLNVLETLKFKHHTCIIHFNETPQSVFLNSIMAFLNGSSSKKRKKTRDLTWHQ